jgi:outer membrane protein TolC
MWTPCRALLATGAFICLSGCAVGPDYEPPAVAVPTQFGAASRTAVAVAPATVDLVNWWQVLHDPQLNALIQRAVASSPDIEIMLIRVQEARLQEIVAIGAILPTLGGSGTAATGSGTDLTRGRVTQPIRAGEVGTGVRSISRMAGFDAAWELDLFGKHRRSLEAAFDDAEARMELRNAALITVVADVAREYFEIRGRQIQREIASKNIAATQRATDLLRTRSSDRGQSASSGSRDGGQPASSGSSGGGQPLSSEPPGGGQPASSAFPPRGQPASSAFPGRGQPASLGSPGGAQPGSSSSSDSGQSASSDSSGGGQSASSGRGQSKELDQTLVKRELATQQARLPELDAEISAAESRLAVLLGTYSAEIREAMTGPAVMPRLPERLRPGVPAELLRRRPDIRAAERELAAATARIGVATADLFPSVTLTAGFGAQHASRDGTTAIPLHGPIWSFGPATYWPLLDFGRLDALINIQDMQAHEALVKYRKTIVAAVEEVDQAIGQYRLALRRLKMLHVALEASRRAVDLTTKRYERTETDFRAVLDVQRRHHELVEQRAVEAETLVLRYIAIYKALGGGWELFVELPPLPPTQPALIAGVRRLTNGWR